jgi:hypothetical protein
MGRNMIVFSLDSLSRRLPRLLFLMTAFIAGLAGYLWYKGNRFTISREWLYLPVSILSGIVGSGLVVTLYCKTNPLVSLVNCEMAYLTQILRVYTRLPTVSSPR